MWSSTKLDNSIAVYTTCTRYGAESREVMKLWRRLVCYISDNLALMSPKEKVLRAFIQIDSQNWRLSGLRESWHKGFVSHQFNPKGKARSAFRVLAIDQEQNFVSNHAAGFFLVRSCRHELQPCGQCLRKQSERLQWASGQQTVTRWVCCVCCGQYGCNPCTFNFYCRPYF